ncbi:hypothetical protein SMC26_30780 [Actinomadura fulvescens]|uniref:Uncharacterized protein n=1 Tax=Actinomadura fulvescens TaxID=46160 RepID=A0ABN3QQB2_9ACTN
MQLDGVEPGLGRERGGTGVRGGHPVDVALAGRREGPSAGLRLERASATKATAPSVRPRRRRARSGELVELGQPALPDRPKPPFEQRGDQRLLGTEVVVDGGRIHPR